MRAIAAFAVWALIASHSIAAQVLRVGVLLSGPRTHAVRVQQEMINENPSLLPGVTVELMVNYTDNDRFTALRMARWQVETQQVRAIVGPEWSAVAKVISPYLGGMHIPHISPSATATSLSSTSEYKYFSRVVPPDSLQGLALFQLVQSFNWTKVAILQSSDDYGRHGLDLFVRKCNEKQIEIVKTVSLDMGLPFVNRSLVHLQRLGVRIFILNVHQKYGNVLGVAKQLGMTDAGYAWIGTDSTTAVDMSTVGTNGVGLLGVSPKTSDGPRAKAFQARYNTTKTAAPLSVYGQYAADALYTVAHAAHAMTTSAPSLATALFATNTSIDTIASPLWVLTQEVFLKQIQTSKFHGVTGPVTMLHNGDRAGLPGYNVVNLQKQGFVIIGQWDTENGLQYSGVNRIVWPGNIPWMLVPPDREKFSSNRKVRVAVFEAAPLFSCVCGKCKACHSVNGVSADDGNVAGLIPDILSHIKTMPGLEEFQYDFHIFRDLPSTKLATYSAQCNPGSHVGCLSGWACQPTGRRCQRQWYNVTGKTPLPVSYSSFVEAVGRGDFDVGAMDITINIDRAKLADFSTAFMTTGISMVRKRSALEQQQQAYDILLVFRPFDPWLWAWIVVSFPLVMLVVGGLEFMAIYQKERTHQKDETTRQFDFESQDGNWGKLRESLNKAKWQAMDSLFFNQKPPKNKHARLFLWVWQFVLFLLASAYTASLASFMINDKMVDICHDLPCMKGSIIAVNEGSTATKSYLKNVVQGEFTIMNTKGTKAALQAVFDGSADAAVGDEFYLQYQSFQNPNFECKLIPSGKTRSVQQLGWVFRKHYFAYELLNQALISMWKSGESGSKLDNLKDNNLYGHSLCSQFLGRSDADSAQTLYTTQFVSLGMMMLATLVFVLIWFIFTHRDHEQNKRRIIKKYKAQKVSEMSRDELTLLIKDTLKNTVRKSSTPAAQAPLHRKKSADIDTGTNRIGVEMTSVKDGASSFQNPIFKHRLKQPPGKPGTGAAP